MKATDVYVAHITVSEIHRCTIQARCPQAGPLVTGEHCTAKLAFALNGIHMTEGVWQDLQPVLRFFLSDYVYYAQSYDLMIWVVITEKEQMLKRSNSMTQSIQIFNCNTVQ